MQQQDGYAAPVQYGGAAFGEDAGFGGHHTYEVRSVCHPLHGWMCAVTPGNPAVLRDQEDMEAVHKLEAQEVHDADVFAHLGTDGNNKLA